MKNLDVIKNADNFLKETLEGYGINWDVTHFNSYSTFELFSETNTRTIDIQFSFASEIFSFRLEGSSEWRPVENKEDFLLCLFLNQFC